MPYDTLSVKQNMPEAEKLTWKASLTDLFSGVILLRVQFLFNSKSPANNQPELAVWEAWNTSKLLSFAFSFFCAMLSLTLITRALLLMHGWVTQNNIDLMQWCIWCEYETGALVAYLMPQHCSDSGDFEAVIFQPPQWRQSKLLFSRNMPLHVFNCCFSAQIFCTEFLIGWPWVFLFAWSLCFSTSRCAKAAATPK